MYPASFDESNFIFDRPDDMTREECEALNAFVGVDPQSGSPIVVTCWKMTKEELEEVNRTGRVWVWHFGRTLQPHAASGVSPF